ncbi:MAG TPA: N-acetylmuramoyl-L-alanine amidase [Candidatus Acidoferrum sp.]|nr:N-acetylmuramoyl-L-alanine amidase [Candidatus Acidoferrum sp.]
MHRGFASVSPVFAVAAALSLAATFSAPALATSSGNSNPSSNTALRSPDPAAAERRQAATSQFARAEDQRAVLNQKAADKRALNDYKQVVTSYRRVYLITPHAPEVPDALLAVAELYTEMGDRFGRTYYQSAVDTYQFLMREYPKSRFLQDAYLRSAKLQKDQLGDSAGAIKTYDAFLKKFPRSKNRREAQEARAELALLQNSAPPETNRSASGKRNTTELPAESSPAVISRDIPREIPREAPKESPRAAAKESAADETPDAGNESAPAATGKIPHVRKISAKAGADATRITIELEGSVQYVSGRIANPDRIYFDLHAARLAQPLLHKKIETESPLVSAIRTAQSPTGVVRVVLDVNGVKDYTASLLNGSAQGPTRLVIDLYGDAKAMQAAQTTATSQPPITVPQKTTMAPPVDVARDAPNSGNADGARNTAAEKVQPAASVKSAKADASTAIPEPKKTLGSAKNGRKPEMMQPASAPQPTRDGQSTLTRALGLKIGRIVIDAGHGGHDTGTIGPTGLMEKDLCLDVALRLGKIVQQRLPGADVVFTRSDDTFIPLEERTHIANEAKADMFISIHANSSQDSGARGIETYYLNLKGSPEAMEVAARENATSDQGIHELEDLVKQIARTEKIDESKEFAEDVQDSLSKRVQKTAKVVKNRGVRKAPFVVLIGADMPSILTEISFLSNPADEKLLKQPEHRQRVAEGIFQGIAGYLQSLNSMSVNETGVPAPRRSTTSAASSMDAARNRN